MRRHSRLPDRVWPTSGYLLQLFAGVSDGRAGRGRDHPVAAVLALAAAAVVAGMRGYTAITGWVADVPPAILADLYLTDHDLAGTDRCRH